MVEVMIGGGGGSDGVNLFYFEKKKSKLSDRQMKSNALQKTDVKVI